MTDEETPIPLKPAGPEGYGGAMEVRATELMGLSKAGDQSAFDRLVAALTGRAFRVALSLVGSREDARDLTQEAFMKTWRARDTYRDGEPFLPWFHRILRNTCFSFLRAKGRLRRQSLSGADDQDRPDWDIEDVGPAPSEGAEREELATVFWAAMQRLSARDREILMLREFEDLSYKAIAHALDIPEGTVMSRLFHARRRLREQLEPHLTGALADFASPGGPGGAR